MEGLAVAPPPTLTRDRGRMAAYDDRGRVEVCARFSIP